MLQRFAPCRSHSVARWLHERMGCNVGAIGTALSPCTAFRPQREHHILTRSPPKRPRRLPVSHGQVPCCHHSTTFVSSHFRVDLGEVETYLENKKLKFRVEEGRAVVRECPFCHPIKGKRSNMYKLHVFLDSGGFHCHRCKAKGSWMDLRRKLGGDFAVAGFGKSAPKNDLVRPEGGMQKRCEDELWGDALPVKDYLNATRGLNDDVLRRYGVGAGVSKVVEGGQWVTHPFVTFPMYDSDGNIVRHKLRSIRTKSGMRLTPKGGGWGLFGLNTVPATAKEVVLTEGEFDAMAVFQATGRPAISLPNGASSLPLELLPALERFDTIVLWMDQDGPGQTGLKQFSRKLGLRRCKAVLTSECKDANEALLMNKDVNKIVAAAGVIPHDSILTFDDMRDQVRLDWKNADTISGLKCKSLPGLNNFVSGLRRGELTIYSGHTGVGKTTLLSQLSLDFCMQGTPTLWGSFEVKTSRLVRLMLEQFCSAHYGIPNGERGSLEDDYDFWEDQFAKLPLFFMDYHGSNDIRRVIETMDYACYVHDCNHIILDNLQFMTSGQVYGREIFGALDHALTQIRGFCTKRDVHVSLVVHPRKEDDNQRLMISSVFGSAKATQEADNVIALQRTKNGPLLHVLKNRYDGVLGGLPIQFDKKTRLFTERGTTGSRSSWKDFGAGLLQYEDVHVAASEATRTEIPQDAMQSLSFPSRDLLLQDLSLAASSSTTEMSAPVHISESRQSTDCSAIPPHGNGPHVRLDHNTADAKTTEASAESPDLLSPRLARRSGRGQLKRRRSTVMSVSKP
eukprot:GFKZ01000357.1.p1 GENE.GFKZ01000357.1~~GFKZ01000357.1.p1  ORF type:complete len:793 (+),score=87.92 GFKZ01000357.1:124-2502(+)